MRVVPLLHAERDHLKEIVEKTGPQRGSPAKTEWNQPFFSTRFPRSSAICTAFNAAPLRRLSDTHQKFRPFSIVLSCRMRLMKVAKSPTHSIGVV